MKEKIISQVRPYVIMTLGLFIFTIGWTAFIIPTQITGGGISGLASTFFYITEIPVALTYFVINIFLLILGIKYLGMGYGIKVTFGVSMVSLFFAILQPIIKEPWVSEPFMASVVGGIISGIGTGMTLNAGGGTGGTDIIASIFNKFRKVGPGKVILFCDFIIIGTSYIVFQSIEKVVYGLATMAVASYAIDLTINGIKQSVQFFIISKNHNEIAARINKEVGRGVTLMDATGWYSQEPVKMVMVVVKRVQSQQVFKIVKQSDPSAFISQGSVMGVYGEGFDAIG